MMTCHVSSDTPPCIFVAVDQLGCHGDGDQNYHGVCDVTPEFRQHFSSQVSVLCLFNTPSFTSLPPCWFSLTKDPSLAYVVSMR